MKVIPRKLALSIERRLATLYPDKEKELMERFFAMIGRYGVELREPLHTPRWTERDTVLITYADMVLEEERAPLETLRRFVDSRLRGAIKCVHLLPFYPWSSDDGFSVIDYRAVQTEYGDWKDVEAFRAAGFDLMFDLVLNHCSAQGQWFKDFVTGIAPARYYFHPMDPETDLSQVVRPRPWPLLTKTPTRDGEAWVWTTFSADQVDLNWQNPDVLFEFLDSRFLYIAKGSRIIRLDAVAFLWKEIGTNCLHLPQTHEMVKLFRDVVEAVAPETIILTETNVPHKENVSYFGDGDEAHMVYQFSLPPLLLHALLRGDPTILADWAKSLSDAPEGCTYFNFTSSHDGVGVRPLQGILPPEEIDWMVAETRQRGGQVSMKRNEDGSESPYELNITYFDALFDSDNPDLGIARFLCSQAVALAMQGVPAVYFHSLTATRNYQEGYEKTGQNRTLNRRKWNLAELDSLLDDEHSIHAKVFHRYRRMLAKRTERPAFHPDGAQEILDLDTGLFGLVRTAPDASEKVVCLYNFTSQEKRVKLASAYPALAHTGDTRDILTGKTKVFGSRTPLALAPYQVVWLLAR